MATTAVQDEATIRIPVSLGALKSVIEQLSEDQLAELRDAVDSALADRGSPAREKSTGAEQPTETAEEAAIRRGREARARALDSQAEISRAAHEALRRMGIDHVQPVPVEQLRDMIRAQGFRDEDNSFSRELIEMREE